MAVTTKNQTFAFCFPYRGVGGVSLLFLRLAEYLAQTRTDYKIFVIDYSDGFIARHLSDKRVQFIEYHDHAPVTLPEDTIVIFQTMTPWSIFPSLRFNESQRLFFWNCFPYNSVPRFPGLDRIVQPRPWLHRILLKTLLRSFRNQCRRFVEILQHKQAIAFMDRPNITVTEWALSLKIRRPKLLPICMTAASASLETRDTNHCPLRLAWIGRVVDFKAPILMFTLSRIAQAALELQRKVSFTIVGDGDDVLNLDGIENEYFSVSRIKYLSPVEIENLLKTNCDILFAMGTSALEGARLAVPTVLLDFSFGKIPETYLFRYFFEANEYSLGELIDTNTGSCGGSHSAVEILTQISNSHRDLAQRCLKAFESKHAISIVSQEFIDLASASELTYRDLKASQLLVQPLPYRVLLRLREMR